VLLINEPIVYAAQTVSDIQQAFEQAVDAYLACCAQQNVTPERPFRGQFNVRVAPALHKSAVLRAQADKTSLNNVVVSALSAYLYGNLCDSAAV
jgi:predicted HicB family RNase H-like nuclease